MTIYNTHQLAIAATAAGSHFFTRKTLRWWNSRIGAELFGGRYFITSEQNDNAWDGKRRYSIRGFEMLEDGRIEIRTIGEFGQYATRAAALSAVARLIKVAA